MSNRWIQLDGSAKHYMLRWLASYSFSHPSTLGIRRRLGAHNLASALSFQPQYSTGKTRSGNVEKLLVVATIFINHFGTPADWFLINTGSASGPSSNPLLVFGTLALVGILSLGLVGNGEAVFKVLATEPLIPAMFFLLGLSPLWSGYFAESLNGAINLGLMGLFATILLVRFELRQIIHLAAIAMAIGIVMDLFWVVAMGEYGQNSVGHWDGLGTQKNDLGGHSLIALLVLLVAARTSGTRRFIYYGLSIVTAVLLVGSQSKTALAAGILSTGCLVVFVVFRSRKTLFGAVLLSISSASVVAVLFVTANIGLIANWLDRDITFSGRTQLWGLVLTGISERPWFGYGYDGFFQGPLSSAHPISAQADWAPTHAHNAYMQMALHVGLIGVIIFVAFTARAVVRATNCSRVVPGPLGLLPLVYMTMVIMVSFTESGVFAQRFGLVLMLVIIVNAKTQVDLHELTAALRSSAHKNDQDGIDLDLRDGDQAADTADFATSL